MKKMFESDDWDLDQDFFNDADEKATEFYSEMDNEEIEPTKRRKVEKYDDANAKEKAAGKKIGENEEGKITRKNLILGMLNRSSPSQSESRNISKKFEKSMSDSTCQVSNSNGHTGISKRNLVLGILQKKNLQNNVIESNEVKSRLDKLAISNGHSKPSNSSNLRNNDIKNFVRNSRKEVSRDTLKPPFADNIGSRKNCTKENFGLHKVTQAQASKKMTLIRRFPGPAGLLPDDMDISAPISYLNNLEENENDSAKNTAESNLSEYCSQNTKSLFSEGAWQLMLDDLPRDFLKDYEIATVKQMANSNYCQSRKIPFLAGMLEYIDHSHENPPIVIKDFTDSIQGTVHRDIPLKYPGLLEPNVVVLLHDVGLLKTSGSLVANKYHILISPSSLLGIYSSKGSIVRTCYMESALRNCSSNGTPLVNDPCRGIVKKCPERHDIDLSEVKAKNSIVEGLRRNNDKEESIRTDEKRPNKSVRSKLLQYISNDIATSIESVRCSSSSSKSTAISSENSETYNEKNSLSVESNPFQSMLYSNENDSDDEMLSQIDVDTIFSNYNDEN